jgi:GNAT superfamily N-acetyltransferase/VanZ family protein
MRGLIIRDACQQDTQAMEDLTVAAWQTAYTAVIDPAYVATRRTNDYAGKFRAMLEQGQYKMLVAELDGQVVGYAAGVALSSGVYDCETKGLYVHPERQGRGVGRELLQSMMEHFRLGGCQRMIVWTFLGVKNNGFYRALGGNISEEEEREFGGKKYRMAGFAFRIDAGSGQSRRVPPSTIVRVATAAVAVAIVLFSLLPIPQPELSRFPLADKIAHALAYLVLSFLLFASQLPGPWVRVLLVAVGGSLFLGGVIELVQPLTTRHRELADLAANLLGSTIGGGTAFALSGLLRRLLRRTARG